MLSGGSREAEVLSGVVVIYGAATEARRTLRRSSDCFPCRALTCRVNLWNDRHLGLGCLPHGWFQGLPECVPDDRPNERFGDALAMHHTQGPDLVHATWSSDEWCREDDVPVLPCSQAEAAAFVRRGDRPDWCSFV